MELVNPGLRIAVLALWGLWLITYTRGGGDLVKAMVRSSSWLDRLAMVAIFGLTSLMTVIGVESFQMSPPPDAAVIVGIALFLAGAGGTFYFRSFLGRMWAVETTLQTEHRIVDSGPYGVVRHPIYLAACVMFLGMGIVFWSWQSLLCGVGVALCYALKAVLEETFLRVHVPDYAEYQRRVRFRLIPRLW